MKTTIFNEKISKCETCTHFHKKFTGKCSLHRNLLSYPTVSGDSSCDCYESRFVSHAEAIKPITPFVPGWQAEQRKAYAKWYNNK